MEPGFRTPIVGGIPDSLSCIPDSKTQDSDYISKNLPRFPILRKQIFSGFRNWDSLTKGLNFKLSLIETQRTNCDLHSQ